MFAALLVFVQDFRQPAGIQIIAKQSLVIGGYPDGILCIASNAGNGPADAFTRIGRRSEAGERFGFGMIDVPRLPFLPIFGR